MKTNIFSTRLKKLYKDKGFTQTSLSEETGIKLSTIQKYTKQSNYDIPSLETTKLLAETLGVDVAYLLGEIKYQHWEDIKVADVTGLSENATRILNQQYYKECDDLSSHLLKKAGLYEKIKHGKKEENDQLISQLDQPLKACAIDYMQQLQTSRQGIDVLCQIITHPKFEELLQTISNAQSNYTKHDVTQKRVHQIYSEVQENDLNFLETDNPFDSANDIYGEKRIELTKQIEQQEVLSKDQLQFYNANKFEASNIFNAIVKDICESNQ